ncbi:MAG TPA: hypothetical protein VFP50_12460, partial [Anaeromyxobacteraceae bacterium]|nr:hypothetical protein [Anaeromyxobacteraceae bacterium]
RSADLGATARTRAGGAAFRPADPLAGVAEAIAFPVSTPPALVTWELGAGPSAAPQAVAPGLVLWDPAQAAFRVAGPQPSAVDALATAGAAGLVAVPTGIEDLRWTPAGPLLVGGPRLSLAAASGLVTVAADLDAPLALPATAADGRLLAVGSMNGAERARLWLPAALATGGAPAEDVVLPGFALLGFFVDGAPWVAWADATDLSPHAARLAAGGALQDQVASAPPDGVLSPNGRTVVTFERGLAGAELTALRIVSTDPATGFATLDRVQLPGPVVSAAFDATGERLYAVVSGPDRLVLVE